MDTKSLLVQAEKEFEEIQNKTFWKDYIKAIEERKDATQNHVDNDKEDVRFHQGQLRAIKTILGIPELILREYRQKRVAQKP